MNNLWIILYQFLNSAHKIHLHKQFFIVKLKSPLVRPGMQNITEYFKFQIMKYISDHVLNAEPNCSVINVYKHEQSQSTITLSIFVNVISQKV